MNIRHLLRVYGCSVALAGTAVSGALSAQTSSINSSSAARDAAAATIEPADLARHVEALTADSTYSAPSSGKAEQTARYLVDEFRKLGLRSRVQPFDPNYFRSNGHWATDTNWLQRYPLPDPQPRRLDLGESVLLFFAGIRVGGKDSITAEGQPVDRSFALSFATSAHLAVDSVSEAELRTGWKMERMMVITGRHTTASLRRTKLREPILLYVPPTKLDTAAQREVIAQLITAGNVVVLPDEDSATFAARRAVAAERPTTVLDWYFDRTMGRRHWVVYVAPTAVDTFLARSGFDLRQVWADTVPRIREVRTLNASSRIVFDHVDTATAVNVLGVLEGTDARKKHEFLIYAASLDDTVVSGIPGDLVGMPNDGLGVAGLLALAKAFSQPGARPQRSVVFLGTSGSRQHFAGARAFTNWFAIFRAFGPNPIPLHISLGPMVRPAGDTLPVVGLTEIDFTTPLAWLAARHPDLGLTVTDGGTVLTPSSDHFAFVHRAIPTLRLSSGSLPTADAKPARGIPTPAEMAYAARALRFAFYLGQEVANDGRWPRWDSTVRSWLNP